MLRVADFPTYLRDAAAAALLSIISAGPRQRRPSFPPSLAVPVDSANISITEVIEATLDKQRDKVGGARGERRQAERAE